MTTMNRWALAFAALAASATTMACGAGADGEEETAEDVSSAQTKGGGGTLGSACTATDAQGHKHSGTYTNDVDGLNCAGSWGGVACTNSDGKDNGKCKSAIVRRPTLPDVDRVPLVVSP